MRFRFRYIHLSERAKPVALVKLFGGKDGLMQAVRELEEEIYKVV